VCVRFEGCRVLPKSGVERNLYREAPTSSWAPGSSSSFKSVLNSGCHSSVRQ